MPVLDFVPILQVSARYAQGWRLAQPLEPNDYAALMSEPGAPASNKHVAAVSRNQERFGKPARPVRARVDDEVDELRDRLAAFSGGDAQLVARRTFGLNRAEATIFMLLVRLGVATYGQIQSAIYSFDALEAIEDVGEAIRSHVKRLRRKLRAHELALATIYGLGFEMAEPVRNKAKAMLAGAVPA
jgi:hypothetical protein